MRFRNREERERYMDSLERQMEHQRQDIQRTLDQLEGSGRRRTALEKLRSSLPGIPGRSSPVREPSESPQTASAPVQREEPFTDEARPQEPSTQRSWWQRIFGP